MRLLFGIAITYAYGKIQTFPVEEVQIGIGRWLDLGFFHRPDLRTVFHIVIGICMAVFAWGRICWIVLPVATFLFLGAGTLNTSQGSLQHHLQAGATTLLVLALWYVGAAIWWRVKAKGSGPMNNGLAMTHRLAPFFAMQAMVAAYVVAGLSKLKQSGFGWIADARNAPVSLRKTADQDFFSITDQVPNSSIRILEVLPQFIQELLLSHPWMAAFVMGPGLFIELFAFLALVGRRSALVVGGLLIGFHYLISEVMNLHFELNNHLIAIFFLNLPYWIWRAKTAKTVK